MKKKSTLVSICIPFYKDEKWIGRVLESILSQDYKRFEIILCCDGAPSPEAVEIFKGIKDKRFLKIEAAHGGAPAARNVAGRLAGGGYIMFWDADAVMLPGALRAYVQILDQHKDIDFVYSPHRYSKDPKVTGEAESGWHSLPFNNFDITQANFIDTCAMQRMELWQKMQATGGWDVTLPCLQDWDYFLRAVKQFNAKGVLAQHWTWVKALPEEGDISKRSNADWGKTRDLIWAKHSITKSDVCVTTVVDRGHARRIAQWCGWNCLGGGTFRPYYYPTEWKAILCIGFHCRDRELDAHIAMFCDDKGKWVEGVKKIVFWTGGDIANLINGVSFMGAKMLVEEKLKKYIARHICATPLVKDYLAKIGIEAEMVNLPYIDDFGLLPLPDKMTVAIYNPYDPPNKNQIDASMRIAHKLPKIKFLAYGAGPDVEGAPANVKFVGEKWGSEWKKFLSSVSILMNIRTSPPIIGSHVDFAIHGRETISNIEKMPGVILCDYSTKGQKTEDNIINILYKISQDYDRYRKTMNQRMTLVRQKYLASHSPEKFKRQMNKIVRGA